jgi:hypothetical protein
MNMSAVSLLLMPLAAALVLGSLYGPAVNASLNPKNEIMTASNYTFQSDTFSAAGAIGSLAGDKSDPAIITGRWSLDVQGGAVAAFSSNLTMVNASGTGYHTIQLSNLSSAEVTMSKDGTALVTGVLDVTINDTEKLSGVNTTISLAQLRALNMTLSGPDYFNEPIYGTANPQQETTAASTGLMPEGSIFGSITEKFRLPQLPNPFR